MSKRMRDQDMPIGRLTRIADFLPPPSQLAVREEAAKVTIALNKSSVQFFKREAQRHRTKYQRMIREVLDRYVSLYKKAA